MKRAKTSWLLVTLGIFVITFGSLGVVQSQLVSRQNRLNDELASAELKIEGLNLEQLSDRQEALEKQLSQTASQSTTARTMLSQPIGSIASSSILFDIAQDCGVEVIELSSSGQVTADLAGIAFSALTLNTRVEGNISDLNSFIVNLNSELTTGTVKSVEISMPETTGGEKASADIHLVLYSYRGD